MWCSTYRFLQLVFKIQLVLSNKCNCPQETCGTTLETRCLPEWIRVILVHPQKLCKWISVFPSSKALPSSCLVFLESPSSFTLFQGLKLCRETGANGWMREFLSQGKELRTRKYPPFIAGLHINVMIFNLQVSLPKSKLAFYGWFKHIFSKHMCTTYYTKIPNTKIPKKNF